MRLENNLDKILIIDFGSQFTQLIARKVRELNVFCEIISHNKLKDYKNEKNVKDRALSGYEDEGDVKLRLLREQEELRQAMV